MTLRLADWAIPARLRPLPAPASDRRAEREASRFAFLLRIAREHAHHLSAIGTFDTDLTRQARAKANAFVRGIVEVHTDESFRWGRLARPTLQLFVLSALVSVEHLVALDRRGPAPSPTPRAGHRPSPTLLQVQSLMNAACAPPRLALPQNHLEDLRAA